MVLLIIYTLVNVKTDISAGCLVQRFYSIISKDISY